MPLNLAPYFRNQLYPLRSESRLMAFPSKGSKILKEAFLNTMPQEMIKLRRYLDHLQGHSMMDLLVQLL